jgi:hypothetical protein
MATAKRRPGEPGEPGVSGGGAGGRGGAGGHGGAAKPEPAWLFAMIFIVIVAIGMSVATIIVVRRVDHNTQQIATLERQHASEARALISALAKADEQQADAIKAARQAEYRICVRQQIIRAAIDLDTGHDEPRLPLYDCKPNLRGQPARRLTPPQSRTFEAYVRNTPSSQLP